MTESHRPTPEQCAAAFRSCRHSGLLPREERAVVFHDLERMLSHFTRLQEAFPKGTIHAVAIKANPIVPLLAQLVEAGAGLEAASIEEVEVARLAGCPPERIVFDSPAKTESEIVQALRWGISLNVDNFDELSLVARHIDKHCHSRVGLRINPCIVSQRNTPTTVGGLRSRFGEPLNSNREAIKLAFKNYPWLNGLHVHIGSQSCELQELIEAARRIDRLKQDIEQEGPKKIAWVDLGGGIPVSYSDRPPAFSFEDYASALKQAVPSLWHSPVRLITEFGRSIHAGCGFAFTRVEYVKHCNGQRVAIGHLGADFLMRTAYQPERWSHDVTVINKDGHLKTGPSSKWALAGPLCFSGDIIATDRALPDIMPGDHLLIRDVGAYTLSLWSHHCNRGMPLILGQCGNTASQNFVTLRKAERPEEVAHFWNR